MPSLVGLARSGARSIQRGYEGYRTAFGDITRRARRRFAARDWSGAQKDAVERLELYRLSVEEVRSELAAELGSDLTNPAVWRQVRPLFSEAIAHLPDVELAETFFNSVTRKVHVTVGVDAEIEYVDLDPRRDRYGHVSRVHQTFARSSTLPELVGRALSSNELTALYADLERDAERVAREIGRRWAETGLAGEVGAIDLLGSVFYRATGAYLVGRLRGDDPGVTCPLVVVLVNGREGARVDAVLTTERELSIVFSYTRSHFLAEIRRPADVIRFLASILPRKPLADLWIAIGYAKHGKTELYRDLIGHLRRSMDSFEHAPGDKGMVMIVFAQPSHDYVLKVIRDDFAPPKTNTRADVLGRYQLVFRHDRAGRMIEAQEFEHLIFDRDRFAPDLLEELVTAAAGTVTVDERHVHIRHLYVERRVRPLNLFLREAEQGEAERVVRDYGQAIRDLATTNIFPGDLLLKNFGVTRSGRVTFYDYDELCLVTDCRFRDLPAARTAEEEMAAEPWYYVDPQDVFPAEFLNFMGLNKRLREVFLAEHAEVLTADFWRDLQRQHQNGQVMDVFPYPPAARLVR